MYTYVETFRDILEKYLMYLQQFSESHTFSFQFFSLKSLTWKLESIISIIRIHSTLCV